MATIKKKFGETKENTIEMYSRWYFEELIENGYVKKIDREAEKIEVLPAIHHSREVHYKTKASTVESFMIEQPRTYKYDYRIVWAEKAQYYFFELYDPQKPFKFGMPPFVAHKLDNGDIVSYIDVKPHNNVVRKGNGGALSSYYTFPFIKKILIMTRGLFINKMIPIPMAGGGKTTCLFVKTFTPARYFMTDSGQQARKRSFPWTPLTSYLTKRQRIVKPVLDRGGQQSLL